MTDVTNVEETNWEAFQRESQGANLDVFCEKHSGMTKAEGEDNAEEGDIDGIGIKIRKQTPAYDDIDVLWNNNIFCHNVAWRLFLTDVRSEKSSPFDTILCEPSDSPSRCFIQKTFDKRRAVHEISQVDMNEFADLGKWMMNQGGTWYCLSHLTHSEYGRRCCIFIVEVSYHTLLLLCTMSIRW